MKLYRKLVRFIIFYGLCDEVRNLTDWIPEEEADQKEKELKQEYKGSWGEIRRKIIYTPVEGA